MKSVFAGCEVFAGLGEDAIERIASIATRRTLEPGETLFDLGAEADRMFVVLTGGVELCVPIEILGEMRNVSVESKGPGSAVGWSAFVKPYRWKPGPDGASPGYSTSGRSVGSTRVTTPARTLTTPRFGACGTSDDYTWMEDC